MPRRPVTADRDDHGGARDESGNLAHLMGDVPHGRAERQLVSAGMPGISAERAVENGALSRTVQIGEGCGVGPRKTRIAMATCLRLLGEPGLAAGALRPGQGRVALAPVLPGHHR